MSEDPNFEETSLFDFVNPEEKKETKKKEIGRAHV